VDEPLAEDDFDNIVLIGPGAGQWEIASDGKPRKKVRGCSTEWDDHRTTRLPSPLSHPRDRIITHGCYL
jgi:hypothetical protein